MSKVFQAIICGLFVAFSMISSSFAADQSQSYLPLKVGNKWVLKSSKIDKPVYLEVLSHSEYGYKILFRNPWSTSKFYLSQSAERYYIRRSKQDKPSLYLDFLAKEGQDWSNDAGSMRVVDDKKTVEASGRKYSNVIQFKEHSDGNVLHWAFAPGVGFVKFGEGEWEFLLDPKSSNISQGKAVADKQGQVLRIKNSTKEVKRQRHHSPKVKRDKFMLGLSATLAANQAYTVENVIGRFEQTLKAGVNMIFISPKWSKIEPDKKEYDFSDYDFWIAQAKKHDIPVVLNLKVIDTNQRSMPKDLQKKRFNDDKVLGRLKHVIDYMMPRLDGTVTHFMVGNEIGSYFKKNKSEIDDYVEFWQVAKKQIQRHKPDALVSATVEQDKLSFLNDRFKELNAEFDFIATTYYPLQSDFTMKPPGSAKADIADVIYHADGRPIVFQEIGYSSSPVSKSSEIQQAKFFDNVFNELSENKEVIGANFFLMSDMSDDMVSGFSKYYKSGAETFLAYLQYLGMFDKKNRPKESWRVFSERGPKLTE